MPDKKSNPTHAHDHMTVSHLREKLADLRPAGEQVPVQRHQTTAHLRDRLNTQPQSGQAQQTSGADAPAPAPAPSEQKK